MRDDQMFARTWLSVALAAQLIEYARDFGLVATASVVLLSVLLGGAVAPVIRASPFLQVALMWVNAVLSLVILVASALQPEAATLDLTLTVVLWWSLFGGPGSAWRCRAQRWLSEVTLLGQPVMPLPGGD
ncbi:hypothetical protein [Deinococcus radiotolerans]|uniref:Uncharacterized protein n=1 Tax=Deinococcus radiotolerans TaxID=1309407 RepID=A0ABQ2FNG3_9DEIO|nr:hypothetical protein [Deinococcus radiotolerans]GGL11240.1 hypothetical protein GCM10010844_32390 [Deinococcus radiotolerans]